MILGFIRERFMRKLRDSTVIRYNILTHDLQQMRLMRLNKTRQSIPKRILMS